MKKKIIDHITFAIIYLFFLSLLRFKIDFSVIFLLLGGLMGAVILESDYLFQAFLVQPELPISQEAKTLAKEGKYQAAVTAVYDHTAEFKKLTFHTLFFQVIFFAFSFFVLTSSGSVFGQGLVLCVLLHLLKEQVEEIKQNHKLSDGWFYRLNISLSEQRQKIYLGVVVLIFLFFTTLVSR